MILAWRLYQTRMQCAGRALDKSTYIHVAVCKFRLPRMLPHSIHAQTRKPSCMSSCMYVIMYICAYVCICLRVSLADHTDDTYAANMFLLVCRSVVPTYLSNVDTGSYWRRLSLTSGELLLGRGASRLQCRAVEARHARQQLRTAAGHVVACHPFFP